MAELKYKPVSHDHKAFLAKARVLDGFNEAYDAVALEYQLAEQMLKARAPYSPRMPSPNAWHHQGRDWSHSAFNNRDWSRLGNTRRRWRRSSAMPWQPGASRKGRAGSFLEFQLNESDPFIC
jgi:hypothetical protein